MIKEFAIVLLIVAIGVVLLSVRLIFGRKKFVHTHIDGNKAMAKRGIYCVKRMDREARQNPGLKIKEHSLRSASLKQKQTRHKT